MIGEYKKLPQTKSSQVRIDRTKFMRSSYVGSLSLKSDIQKLIDEMNPAEELEKLREQLIRDLEVF
jgi:hypothetical protein